VSERDAPAAGIEAAWAIARRVHDGQVDKLGGPYLDHVRRVAEAVRSLAPPDLVEACVLAAVLHDTVEDGDIGLADLGALGFDRAVVDAVDSVTRRPDEDYTGLIERAAADPVGRWVKLADNLDNGDPARLALLEPATARRLREKYDPARERLLEVCRADPPDR
jgi:(p)ppGpp synthase/HD superfamily hydrolase